MSAEKEASASAPVPAAGSGPGPGQQGGELELSNAGRGVWLVKVPKYMAAVWEASPASLEVGRLRITRKAGAGAKSQANVALTLSEGACALVPGGTRPLPRHHRLDVSTVTRQTLGVFSLHAAADDAAADKLAMEGRIVQKLECRPYADDVYMKLKQEAIKRASQPQRRVQQYDKVVTNFKPVSDHKHNIEYQEKKKAEGKKARDDREAVLNMLFAAFEKHQYYNIKDLQKITRQPIVYLKEVLKEVCNYNLKNPHKNMWELKPEYRYYERDEAAADEADADKDKDDSD